jgi:iron complex outermembrane receptor protein
MKVLFKKSAMALALTLAGTSYSHAQAEIEEIFVMASKRVENIQDVPMSVALVSGETINVMGITDMEDLSLFVPNFEINSSGVIPNLYVRGLGGGLTHATEQSVGRFIDDVYISRAVINLHPFMDVGAVEVVRGPQGTLFGKNTAAGAMIIRTNEATEEFNVGINISDGSYATTGGVTEVNGFVNGSLSDKVSGRLALLYRDRDGFYENLGDGPDGAQREDYGIQGKLNFNLSDTTVANLKIQYMDYTEFGSDTAEMNGTGGPPLFVWQAAVANSGAPNADQYIPVLDWLVHYTCTDVVSTEASGSIDIGSFCPGRDQDTTNVTFDIEHDVNAGTFKFIAAHQEYSYKSKFHGFEGGGANLFRAYRDEDYSGFSSELRFTSEEGDVFDYIAGMYYEDSEIDRNQYSDINLVGFGPPVLFRKTEPWSQTTETFAVFAQARWHFSDRVTGIFGGRWSTETKDFLFEDYSTAYGTSSGPRNYAINPRDESRDESRFTPSFTLQYELNEDINLFASATRGHKTGGFSDRVDTQTGPITYDAEIVDGFELGMKGYFFENAMSLNVVLYKMDIQGLQLATQVPGTINFVVGNAADSVSQGVEIESNWALTDNWTVGLNYAYTDATYKDYLGAGNCGAQFKNSDGVCDLSEQTLQYAPENKASAFAEYFAFDSFGNWDFGARINLTHSSDQYTDVGLFDFAFQESYETVEASFRLVSPSNKVIFSLIGKNLTNEKINAWTAPSGPNTISSMAAPRFVALRAGWNY